MCRPGKSWRAEHISPSTDSCRGLRFLPASPIPLQIYTTCIRHTRLQRTSGQPAAKETASLCVAALIRWRRARQRWGCRRRWGGGIWWSGFAKARIIDPRVDLDFFRSESLLEFCARAALVDPECVFQALDLAEIRREGLPREFLVFGLPHAFPLQKQKSGGVNKVKPHVPVFVREFQAVNRLVVQFLFANQFNLVAFGLVVHERAVKVGLIGNVLEVFGRQRLNVFAFRERIDHPAGRLAIVNTDNSLPFDGDLDVHLQRTLELHHKGAFHVSREGDTAGYALGLDGDRKSTRLNSSHGYIS